MFGACPASPFPLIAGRIDLFLLVVIFDVFFTYFCDFLLFFLYPILSFIVSFLVDKLEREYFMFLYCMYIKKVFIK